LNALIEKPQYVEELSQRLGLASSTVSFHLKKLESAKLVYKEKEQYYIVYHHCDKILNMSLRELISFNDIDKFIQDERIQNYNQKVLNTFIKNKKLVKLPVQRKKRMIIIDEFVKLFEPGKRYPEKALDCIIKTLYDDYCTVRRIMIDEQIMERDKQVYWLKNHKGKEEINDK
ncbi:MAG: DUF2087 domain-containing protein, partial [Bacteroidota bacterium]|nr:DUF2087 domain-containing protein [Bacteroidota bacterium]